MACDLERTFGNLAARLPVSSENGEKFALDESVIPVAPPELSSDSFVIRKGLYQRLPGCRGDNVDIIASRPTLRQLGLLALAVLFHEQCDRSIIHITTPESRVKHIVLEYKHWLKTEVSGFRVRPWVFGYVPDDVGPTYQTQMKGFGAPLLRLTNLSDNQKDEQDWQTRDTLWGFGGTTATAEIAEYLLNAGRTSATLGGFTIPANKDFFAAEVHLWLPETWERIQRNIKAASSQSNSKTSA
jgi:hypothetical protein